MQTESLQEYKQEAREIISLVRNSYRQETTEVISLVRNSYRQETTEMISLVMNRYRQWLLVDVRALITLTSGSD